MQLSAALGEMLASLVVRMFGDGEAPVLASAGATAYRWRPCGRGAVEVLPVLSWGGDRDQ